MSNITTPSFIQLRLEAGTTSEGDLTLTVQEKTFEYLKNNDSEKIKISAYLDRDWPSVATQYAEVYVEDGCTFSVDLIKPGSRTRKVTFPDEMKEGEQLTIHVTK